MSTKEQAISLIDTLDEGQIQLVFNFVRFLKYEENNSSPLYSFEKPNAETVEAIKEVDTMINNGSGQQFEGSTEEFMRMMLED
ncbi:MAG: hypothetical protein ACI4TH_08950, partial [Candidatus Ornithomonoglobus sp.]